MRARRVPPDQPKPKISVVTVALNAASALPLTIESVLAQDYFNLEYVVVDGRSWDATSPVLRRYAERIDQLVVRADAGIYSAMNDALDDLAGDYVIFLNAGDTFYGEDAVSRMVDALVGRPDIFYGDHIYVDGRREHFKRAASFDWLARKLCLGAVDHAWHSAIPGHQATFASVELLRRLRFDTRLKVAADHEILFRAHAEGAVMQYVDELVAHYHSGGFSAAAGSRCQLENASIYRRFTTVPGVIDRLFFPAGSPFPPQTERTGFALGGLVDDGGADVRARTGGGEWVVRTGCLLSAPAMISTGIEIAGYNDVSEQGIDILHEGTPIGSVSVPKGSFRREASFLCPLPGSSIVIVRPWLSDGADTGPALGFALRTFRFWTEETVGRRRLAPGKTLGFRAAERADLIDILGAGWSDLEPTHLWSIGQECDLWLAATDEARSIRIDMAGNPHVPGGIQPVDIVVNGTVVLCHDFVHGERRQIDLDATGVPWQIGGINHILIRPDVVSAPPAQSGDTRELGVCVWDVSVR